MSGIKYKGSELWKNIEYTNDLEQLSNMAKYIDGAVVYHEQNKDDDNANFFKEAQSHWQTKVKVKIRKTKNMDGIGCDALSSVNDPK